MRCHYRQIVDVEAKNGTSALKKFEEKGEESGTLISDEIYESTHIDAGYQEPFIDEDGEYS